MRQLLPTAGWVLVIELSMLGMYGLDRLVLGIFASPAEIGLYEGPIRAHNAFYALSGALGVATLPTAAALQAAGDRARLSRLVLTGSRLSLAAVVPLCVTAIVLAGPALELWLGERFRPGATALALLVAPWLVFGALALTPNFLVGAGAASATARALGLAAAVNLAVSLALTPSLGVEGPAIGTAAGYLVAAPLLIRAALSVAEVPFARLIREAWLPAAGLGLALAAALVLVRLVAEPEGAAALLPLAVGAPVLYWIGYALLFLGPEERRLLRRERPG
jgi:O-antigen/teichoic acid export membrane protein